MDKPGVLSYYPGKLFSKPCRLPIEMNERPKGRMNSKNKFITLVYAHIFAMAVIFWIGIYASYNRQCVCPAGTCRR